MPGREAIIRPMAEPRQPADRRALADLPMELEEQVLAALERDDAGRDAALAALCAAHPMYASVLRSWVAEALGEAMAPAGPANEPQPEQIGPYRVVRLLGRGGFGDVWLCEQREPVVRQLAVKVLRRAQSSRELMRRFAAEREALNRMEHPGIARLIDAGSTASGQPWFAMEFVRGVALPEFCRSQRLGVRRRVELFLDVLGAVQHAHQKAVLHRDLSSNNVLVDEVDGKACPKIIDFGIAKSLTEPLQGAGMTFHGTLMGTPEFMSPEQAQGTDVDTRTDIFALGVQLYELLAERLPIPSVALRSEGPLGIARILATHPVEPPSAVAPDAVRRTLRGDLDAVVMKAIARDREERYGTVAEFAADLRAWLRREPVRAADPTHLYRLRKFVARNLAAVVAGTATLAALVGALLFSLATLSELEESRDAEAAARLQVEARADAGFLLLANQELLRQAEEELPALFPPEPARLPAIRQWLTRHGLVLQAAVEEVRAKIGRLAGATAPADMHLRRSLERLLPELERFCGADGSLQLVQDAERQCLHWVEVQRTHRTAWEDAVRAIKQSDGRTASNAYRGLQLAPQAALVPLGMDRTTGLWEFLDLTTQRTSAPLPARDPTTGKLQTDADCGIVFVLLPGGEFRMGAHRGEPGLEQNDPRAEDDELPPHLVRIEPFLLSRAEVTEAQWQRLLHGSSAGAMGSTLPATGMSWDTATEMLRRRGMQLPTEAQWEYACRAGSRKPWPFVEPEAPRHAWLDAALHPTGQLAANAFGLFDLHGNAAEWCRDTKVAYTRPARNGDGLREAGEGVRTVRGGSTFGTLVSARSSARAGVPASASDRSIGLRPARALRRQ
ncbi:MAG: hypothetical protein RL148_467 [Planctomycetota bacterium]|jgi:tRNA A-37 threonylcarbamoyl transferase component Bud32